LLSPLQEDLLRLITALPEAQGFALAGGAALILRGTVDRLSEDLDLFGTDPNGVALLALAIEAALRDSGMESKRTRDNDGFVRLAVTRGDERCEVDLGYDARLWPLQNSRLGPVIADEELAADKTLALFGRAVARDFVDVHALAGIHGEDRLVELAVAKDAGFSTTHFAEALRAFGRLDRAQFDVDDATFDEIRVWAAEWAKRIARE
jgi:hypothetical protein